MKFQTLKYFILSASLLLTMTITPEQVAVAAEIGYVDARRLIEQAPQGKDEIKKLEAEFAERNRELKGHFDQFKAQESDLEKNGMLMAAEELESKTKDLREVQRKLKRDQREYNEDYTQRRNEGLAKLERIVTEAIIVVAKKEKLDVVFQQAVYANPNIDLTDKVLEVLKADYKQ